MPHLYKSVNLHIIICILCCNSRGRIVPHLYKSVTFPSMSLYLMLQFKGWNSAPLIHKCKLTFHVFVSYAAVQGDRIVPHFYKSVTLPFMSLFVCLIRFFTSHQQSLS